MDKTLEHYVSMLNENEVPIRNEAQRILLMVCEKILRFPHEEKYRTIRLDDRSVTDKLLPAIGAMECLFYIGFVEDGDCLSLPKNISLAKLETFQGLLSSILLAQSQPKISSKKHMLTTATSPDKMKFFQNIMTDFHRVMQYEDPRLQEKTRSVVPVVQLEIQAMEKIRQLQRDMKISQLHQQKRKDLAKNESTIIAKDFFLGELLYWFKYSFFTWVNSPQCTKCSKECSLETVKPTTDPKCSKIEIHRCYKCNVQVEFPRYVDADILLSYRRGRCGEWANVFTLLCRSFGYDARLVCDKTDHVWTEIWSATSDRWIHIDPCENVMDQPLMYERAWNKKLSYIIAYSRDEVQDVTWRYTIDQIGVMSRRVICSEENLLHFLQSLNKERQNSVGYTATRKQYVIKRNVLELAGMLHVPGEWKDIHDNHYQERTTGSYIWRLARGEISMRERELQKNHVWDVSKYGQRFELRYFIVEDIYKVVHLDNSILEQRSGWEAGIDCAEGGIFRKVEDDWKMVYLACSPNDKCGYVKWSFENKDTNLCIETFNLQARCKIFHKAKIMWEVRGFFDNKKEDNTVVIPIQDCDNFQTEKLKGATRLTIIAKLICGEEHLAWQHAQLFRESLKNTEQSMVVTIQLCTKN